MRVLDTHTGQFVEIDPSRDDDITYAILSHTWDSKEQIYQELKDIQQRYVLKSSELQHSLPHHNQIPPPSSTEQCHDSTYSCSQDTPSQRLPTSIWDDQELSPKIREACKVAREKGYRYLWIDSCCIDKTSSSELSESINSMYQWYARADVCYAFLPDVPAEEDHREKRSNFRYSRWFRRGWTLQELIAPRDVQFLSMQWTPIGSKESLADLLVEITNIQYNALLHIEPLDEFSVAQRLSWAAERETTRVEDRAYSLLGIFDINMPTLYGEGKRAFRRLQEEIMRRTPDQTLFAWTDSPGLSDPWSRIQKYDSVDTCGPNVKEVTLLQNRPMPFFAQSPGSFRYCSDIEALPHDEVARLLRRDLNELPSTDYDFTPHGIRTQLPVISIANYFPSAAHIKGDKIDIPAGSWYLVILGCVHKNFPECLLGRVCCIRSLGSAVEFFHCYFLSINGFDLFDLLPLTSTNITRLNSSQISIKTLYIPQPQSVQPATYMALQKQHQTINLVLPVKTRKALSAQGYTSTLRYPDDSHPHIHTVTLTHTTHTVTVEYRHTLQSVEHGAWVGQEWSIEADVKMYRAPHQADTGPGTRVSWQDTMLRPPPWQKDFPTQDVMLDCAGDPMALTIRLGLAFATTNHYLLHIELKTSDIQRSGQGDVVTADASGEGARTISGSVLDNGAQEFGETPIRVPLWPRMLGSCVQRQGTDARESREGEGLGGAREGRWKSNVVRLYHSLLRR